MTKKKIIKVCHLTTVHARYDTRVFIKECNSLARNGYDVKLIVADGKGDEIKNNIEIYDIGRPSSRLRRMIFSTKKMYRKALLIDADIYHFHDPELFFVGKKLLSVNKKVIYDAHEDVPRQILSKSYIPKIFVKKISFLVEKLENRITKKFHLIITSTTHIKKRFLQVNNNSEAIHNYPFLSEFSKIETTWNDKEDTVCYIGSFSHYRGNFENIEALAIAKKRMILAGMFQSPDLLNQCKESEGWDYVDFVGFVGRTEVVDILSKSKVGLVTLHPTIAYLDSLPVKMFEYMAAGIPVITSDFELWKSIVEGTNCGICVDPLNISEIAEAILKLLKNDTMAEEMGKNGKKAVLEKYNWETEETKLLDLYRKL